jgi:hypothetical protein
VNDPGDLDLLEAHLEGRLLPADAEALETRLKAEPTLARALVALARDEILLARWAQAELGSEEEHRPQEKSGIHAESGGGSGHVSNRGPYG